MNNKLIKCGYLVTFICYSLGLVLGLVNNNDWKFSLFFLGGASLLITSLYKILTTKKAKY